MGGTTVAFAAALLGYQVFVLKDEGFPFHPKNPPFKLTSLQIEKKKEKKSLPLSLKLKQITSKILCNQVYPL